MVGTPWRRRVLALGMCLVAVWMLTTSVGDIDPAVLTVPRDVQPDYLAWLEQTLASTAALRSIRQ